MRRRELDPQAHLGPGAFGLRALSVGDAERFAEALQDPMIRYWMHGVPATYSMADALAALSNADSSSNDGDDPYWAWALVDVEDRLMGKIGLSEYDGSSVNLSYWLHPDARGRGWMTMATEAVTTSAHDPDGLAVTHVRASVAAANQGSRRVLERAGYRYESSTADYRMGDGTLAAGVIYGHARS